VSVPTYLINLDRSADRLERMTLLLNSMQIDFERVPAADGRNLSAAERRAIDPRLSPAEAGCLLSHRGIWQRIANENHTHATVLEDDIVLGPRLADLLADPSWIPANADIVKLETTRRPVGLLGEGIRLNSGTRLWRLTTAHFGSAAYIISRDAARRLLTASFGLQVPVDEQLFDPKYAVHGWPSIYQVDPAPCRQAPENEVESIIRSDRRAHHRKLSVLFPHLIAKAMIHLRRRVQARAALDAGHALRVVPFDAG
jgi:glycosyl transferase family 25